MKSKTPRLETNRIAAVGTTVMDKDLLYPRKEIPLLMRLCIIFFSVNVLCRFLIACYLPITYKEAYFWEWAQFLSPGYLDHPPMVAWLIYATTSLFHSHSIVVIRLSALILGTASSLLIYRLAMQLFHDKTIACRALLIALCIPVLNVIGILMIPDTSLIFFELLIFNVLVSTNEKNKHWCWPLIGVLTGLALLSKLVIILSIAAAIPFLCSSSISRTKSLLVIAGILAVAIASPYFWWEYNHGWPGLRLQLWERHVFEFGFSIAKVGEVILEQLFAATPFILPAIIASLVMDKKKLPASWKVPVNFLQTEVVAMLGVILIAGAFITQTHPHWAVLAYPPASVLLAVYWTSFPDKFLTRKLGLFLSILMSFFVIATIIIATIPQIITRVDPHYLSGSLGRGLVKGKERLLGLDELGYTINEALRKIGKEEKPRVFTISCQFANPLGYILKQPVICIDAYIPKKKASGGYGQRYYLPESYIQNANGIFLTNYKSPLIEYMLRELFIVVEPFGSIPQQYAGQTLSSYYLYHVKGFSPANFKHRL